MPRNSPPAITKRPGKRKQRWCGCIQRDNDKIKGRKYRPFYYLPDSSQRKAVISACKAAERCRLLEKYKYGPG